MPNYFAQTVVLFGTDHNFQLPLCGKDIEQTFYSAIYELSNSYGVRAIAEEMNLEALNEIGATYSIAQQLCNEKDLRHKFIDPTNKERKVLGIIQDNDIKAEGFLNNWTPEHIDAEILVRGADASDSIRENFWLSKVMEIDTWPLLFICGADHFNSFADLLRENGVSVVESCKDWEP